MTTLHIIGAGVWLFALLALHWIVMWRLAKRFIMLWFESRIGFYENFMRVRGNAAPVGDGRGDRPAPIGFSVSKEERTNE